MALWDELFNEVRPLVPTLSVFAIRRAAKTTAKLFCQEHRVWKKDLVVTITPETIIHDVSADLPTGSGIYAISSDPTFVTDGSKIIRSSPEELSRINSNWRNDTAAKPEYCYRDSMDSIAFVPSSTGGMDVDVRVILTVLQNSTQIDDAFLEDYWDVLVLGTLSVASQAPTEPWYDMNMVIAYTNAYRQAALQAAGHSNHDLGGKTSVVSYGGL